MRSLSLLVLLVLVVLWAGCWSPPSLHRLYTEKEVVFEPSLVGVWLVDLVDDGPNKLGGLLIFEDAGNNSYRILYADADDNLFEFEGHLVHLGEHVFLDTYPLRDPDTPGVLGAHLFYRLDLEGDTLHIFFLDDDWLKTKLEAGEFLLPNESISGTIVLTAPTPELQQFATQHPDDFKPFPEKGGWRRWNSADTGE